MSKIISGKILAQKHEEYLKDLVQKLSRKPEVVSILIGEDPASIKYSKMKQQKAKDLGINFKIFRMPNESVFDTIAHHILTHLNSPSGPNGIMIQLPIPKKVLGQRKEEDLLKAITPQKDIDGLTGHGPFLPATVRGVLSILESLGNFNGKTFAVVGSEGMVGKPMVKTLKEKGFKVIEVDKKIPQSSLMDVVKADIVISCTGQKNLIKPKMIKKDVILIDVGSGDFDPECYKKASAYTPKIGGVGPMTIISLMENIVESVASSSILDSSD